MGLSWTIGAAWPFLAKSTRAAAVIVPFDFGDDLKYPDLVMIVPLGYLPTDVLQEFQRLLDTHHASGLRCMYEFPNSTHFYIRAMSLDCMLVLMSFTLARNMPMVITLTLHSGTALAQSTCRLYWLVCRMNGAVAAHTSQLD